MGQSIEKIQDPPCLPDSPGNVPVFDDGILSWVKGRPRVVTKPKPKPRPLVLVVNDMREIVDLLSEWLVRQGFRVATAHDGIRGLDAVRSLRPNLVLLNFKMPGLDGLSVLQALRADPETSLVKVIMDSVLPIREAALRAGAQDFMQVPFNLIELREKVDRILRS